MKAEDIIFEEETLSEEEVDQFQGEEMESIYVAQQPESVCASEKELDMSDDLEEAAETGEFLDNSDIPEDDRVHSEPIEADLKETYKLVNQPKKEGKQRRSFTTAVKLQLVEYAEKHGNYQTGRDFNLSEASVRGWRKQKALLLTSDKGTRKAFRKGGE